ncbi:MAG TPA: outer membrane beta-barrel protein [Puia sp.]|nr:outer membrane beta-barrel protein [Puia sp.]
MQDPEFEKQVRKKMEELLFSPSESVWAGVETRIKRDRDRRRPLLWMFLAAGLVLGGGFYLLNQRTDPSAKQITAKSDANHVPGAATPSSAGSVKQQDAHEQSLSNDPEKSGDGKTSFKPNGSVKKPASRLFSGETHAASPAKSDSGGAGGTPGTRHPSLDSKKEQRTSITDNSDVATGPGATHPASRIPPKPGPGGTPDAGHPTPDSQKQSLKKGTAATKPAVAKSNPPAKKKSWQLGFTAAAGASPIYQSLFQGATSYTAAPLAYYSFSPAARTPSRYYTPAQPKPGFSFSAGAFVQKTLGKRISVSGGLNYHYFSNIIQTGDYSGYNLLIASPNTGFATVRGYYSNGNTQSYTNQYHFLELPLNLNYQLNQGKKLLFFAEAGVSIAQLLSTNALHFDYGTGAYYHDNSVFNKTQFNGALALQAGFYSGKTFFKLGPQLQYGFTNLLSTATGDKQQLFFLGLQLTVIPGRTKR